MKALLVFYVIILYPSILFSSGLTRKPDAIAIQARADGFGAYVLSTISAIVYADLTGKLFCYNPIGTMQHNYNNDPDFIAKKEKLLNFIDHYLTVSEVEQRGYPVTFNNGEAVYVSFFGKHIHEVAIPLLKIKKIFRANKKDIIDNYFDNDQFNIAVHIRRPNPHDDRIYGTDIPDEIYLKIINKLRLKYADKNPLFHIYSQGNIDNFNIYSSPDVVLHINEELEKSYPGMVFASVLVTGRSSLSYTAGCLSDGIVYYTSYSFAPALPDWITVEKLLAQQ